MKKILQNSRETRLSQVAGPEWERPPYFSRHRKILILFPPKVFICHSGFGTCATGTSPSPYFVT